VSSTVKVNNLQLGQSLTATNNFSWYQPSSPDGTVRLGVGNAGATTSDVLVANSSGNVGIGTSSPAAKLNIAANSEALRLSGSTPYLSWRSADNATNYGYIQHTGTNLAIANVQAGNVDIYTSNLLRATLDASGNLGLGVTPSAWINNRRTLQIGGSVSSLNLSAAISEIACNFYWNASSQPIYQNTGPASFVNFNNNTSGGWAWNIAPSGTAGNAISFTQAMTLDASGNLLVGATSFAFTPRIGFSADGASYSTIQQINNTNTGISSVQMIRFTWNGTSVGRIESTSTATSYLSGSDERLKENIVDAPSAIDSVNAIKVRSFDWKEDGSHIDYGYIAQELLAVVPEAVSVPADAEEMMGVDFGKLTPRLVKAIQELSAQVTTLQAEINALKA
jgi:hypothetical protein